MSPRTLRPWRTLVSALVLATLAAPAAHAQGSITSPKAFLGHNIGDDYFLPTYDQFMAYWKKIDGESNRMQVMEIGKTAEGRPHLAAIVTAPENFAKLARYKEISKRLQAAKGLTDDQARALAKEGKSVVWIDGGLHATEVVGANQLIETSYQLVSRNDEETNRILKDVIVIMVHANPDGMQMVAKCYMQNPVPEQRRAPCSTRLYNKYAGHDNNRDFYMSNLPESQNLNKLMYWEWMPQIMYNHHQTGPVGTVIFSPPFRDPFNYNLDPMIVMGLDMVGAAMHQRFLQENKPGFTMRSGSSYSTWWNGGLRTTAYFQNIIGILTEIIGSPTPSTIPITLSQMLPRGDLPAPIAPQEWHFRQSIDYSVTANYSILDLASRYKDQFLFNIYRMGANQIERGSRDHWTVSNEDMARADSAIKGPAVAAAGRGGRGGAAAPAGDAGPPDIGFGGRGPSMTQAQYNAVFKDPARRDPRAYVIPASQPDFATATKFINTMRYVGVEVQQATAPFTANGKEYGAGSYVVHSAQAGRAHVIDMFEPQDHPNDMDERGIPKRPYDNAGWTLAYQMGVQFDRFMDDVKGPFVEIKGLATPLAGTVAAANGAAGYLISGSVNDAFTVANRVLKANGEVFRLARPMTANGKTFGAGSFYVTASAAVTPALQAAAKELGVSMEGTTAKPDGNSTKLTPKRVALWDTQTGSMSSGWTRFLLERFEFPFQVVCGAGFDDTDLKGKYDVIVLPSDGSIGGVGGGGGRGGGGGGQDIAAPASSDPDLRSLCDVTKGTGTGATALANLKKFVEAGGIVVAAGNSSRIGQQLGLPMTDYLVERQPGAADVHLGNDKFYVPGSVLRVATDSTASGALGMQGHTDVFFNNNPVFRLDPTAAAKGVRPVMWFDTASPLRSGWAWGQNYLQGGTTAVEATMGRGKMFLFGPEITFRGQPHATFKMLFNSIYNVDQTPKITP
jgi:hypothetical protein